LEDFLISSLNSSFYKRPSEVKLDITELKLVYRRQKENVESHFKIILDRQLKDAVDEFRRENSKLAHCRFIPMYRGSALDQDQTLRELGITVGSIHEIDLSIV
jgi:hypothetical protein